MRRAGALAALVTTAMEAGKLREAAAAVTGTQSWCATPAVAVGGD